jgi:hypothetical protein
MSFSWLLCCLRTIHSPVFWGQSIWNKICITLLQAGFRSSSALIIQLTVMVLPLTIPTPATNLQKGRGIIYPSYIERNKS